MSNRETLQSIGIRIRDHFRQVFDQVSGQEPKVAWQNLLTAEIEHFELWAVNLGLFAPGHASLDYRVREAASIREALWRYLVHINESIDEVSLYCLSTPDLSTAQNMRRIPERSDDPDSDEGTSDELSEGEDTIIDLLLDSIRDPINRLYRTSIWIRNPSSRFAASKALRHEEIDDDTGLDLLTAFEPFDRDLILTLFSQPLESYTQQPGSHSSREQHPSDTSQDQEKNPGDDRPTRRHLEEYLIERLVRANYRRRQQLSYWRHHRAKLALYAESENPTTVPLHDKPGELNMTVQAPGIHTPSVTTATNLDLNFLPFRDGNSLATVSVYAPKYTSTDVEPVTFPPPPELSSEQNYFECPYCFTICPEKMAKTDAWRAHLIHDLRPYICTFRDCKSPDLLYDTLRDWIQHELTQHGDQGKEYTQEHTRTTTGKYRAEGASVCPLCYKGIDVRDTIHNHMARHLERIAVFALPRYSNHNESDGVTSRDRANGSAQANVDTGDSRAGDFLDTPQLDYTSDEKNDAPPAQVNVAIDDSRAGAFLGPSQLGCTSGDEDDEHSAQANVVDVDKSGAGDNLTGSYPDHSPDENGHATSSRIMCPHCNDRPEGWRNEDYNSYHGHAMFYHGLRKSYICVERADDVSRLADCESCLSHEVYSSPDDAVDHLRLKHFSRETGGVQSREYLQYHHVSEIDTPLETITEARFFEAISNKLRMQARGETRPRKNVTAGVTWFPDSGPIRQPVSIRGRSSLSIQPTVRHHIPYQAHSLCAMPGEPNRLSPPSKASYIGPNIMTPRASPRRDAS